MVKLVTERRVTYYDYGSVYNRRDVASRILTLYYLTLMTNVNATLAALKLSVLTATSTSRRPLDSSTFLITLIAVLTFAGSQARPSRKSISSFRKASRTTTSETPFSPSNL